MKVKILNNLLLIDLLTIFLAFFITIIPAQIIRIIIGLPFILFFPGYTLMGALFPEKELDTFERIALSFGMSIALTVMIGLGLNYTPWGIGLESILYAISVFIILMSVTALVRQLKKGKKLNILTDVIVKFPGWDGGYFNKTLTIISAVAVIGTIGMFSYDIVAPKAGEKFTEFYLLGYGDKAQNYPSLFTILEQGGYRVSYGDSYSELANYGEVKIGLVNHEQQVTSYSLKVLINDEPVELMYKGQNIRQIEGIVLEPQEKWEEKAGFAPQYAGDNQKVEFVLYKDGETESYLNLHLWITVRE